MNSDRFSVVYVLDAHECLNEEGLGVFEVEVEETHHGYAEVYCSELLDGG
jgi:hypothetical protein